MRRLYRLILYLSLFFCSFLLVVNTSFGQCSITNLNSTYCTDEAIVTLASSPAGLTYYRTGSNSAITQFDPSSVGVGTYTVVGVNPTVQTYNVVTTGTFAPIAGSGTGVTGLGNNTLSGNITIPFNFYLFGTARTIFRISPNGYIDFGTFTSVDNPPSPSPDTGNPNEIIAGAWTNLDLSEGGTIDYFTSGAQPYRRFIINFNAVEYDGASTNTVSFQIQLHESTNIIEIHSASIQSNGSSNRFQGIENSVGTVAYWVQSPNRNSTDWTATNDFVSFVPTCLDIKTVTVNAVPSNSLTVSPASTTICSGNSVSVTINSAQPGVYYQLQNDADNTPLSGLFGGTGANLTISSDALSANTTLKVYAVNATTLCDLYLTNKVVVTVNQSPTTSAAGPDQSKCNNGSFTLAANNPVTGMGAWTVIGAANGAVVTTPSAFNSGVTGLTAGNSVTLRWTISNGVCTASTDDVVLTNNATPPVAAAGPDIIQCNNGIFTMAGNLASPGTGLWTIQSGSAIITNDALRTTTVTGVIAGSGNVVLRWTITNGACATTFDELLIRNEVPPSTSSAGPDQSLCNTSNFTLAANTPASGTGAWSIISGAATITTPASPTSTITGVGAGASVTLRWTITNGTSCAVSTDDVVITNGLTPPASNAGPDIIQCNSSVFVMAANNPVFGTGSWSLISGVATITNTLSRTTTVTGVTAGSGNVVLRWTINTGCLPQSTDEVTIRNDQAPTTATAGPDQNICGTSATLAANAPVTGTGAWSIISGAGGSFVLSTN
ncbi:MAG: hypothetical protein ABIR06_06840, partial [Cyclobacteriaceae bacterium]